MSLGDLFFPGNPERRVKVVSLATEIKTYMEQNFYSTNNLIDVLNDNITPSPNLQKIDVSQSDTLSKNADVLINKMEEIQAIVDDYDNKMAEELEPDLYRALTDPDISFVNRFRAAKQAVSIIIGVIATLATVAVIIAVKGLQVFLSVITKVVIIKTVAVASLAFAVLGLGIDAIIGAILGAIERDKLNDAIDELEKVQKDFKPASIEYNYSIVKVKVFMQFFAQNLFD